MTWFHNISGAALIGAALTGPTVLAAHPHIFIDAGLRLVVGEDGGMSHVEVTWNYDQFYSLLIFEELELDSDYDGALTPEELRKLEGFDLEWVEGYEGDLYVTRGDEKLSLGAPQSLGISVENGRIISRHSRAVTGSAAGVLIEIYDPGYYSAYSLSEGVEVTGSCAASVTPANIDAAMASLEELLFARPQSEVDANFPEVGRSFADKVDITCTE